MITKKTDFVIDVNKSKNKKSETNPKKRAKKATNLSANEELEENLAKDVILELKDVIKKFDNNKET